MDDVGKPFRTAAIFGASGGIGHALATRIAKNGTRVWAGSRAGDVSGERITPFAFDLLDEPSIAEAAGLLKSDRPDLIVVATGTLTLPDGTGPERSYRRLDGEAMAQAFALNTIGPALIAKHILPLMDRDDRSVFAALSARVGSIGDNGLGGWHSYRASKAALNMLLKNFAIELNRTHKSATIVGLHPGTVDTALSLPFQTNLPDDQLTTPGAAAANLIDVLEALNPEDSGLVFDWKGEPVEP